MIRAEDLQPVDNIKRLIQPFTRKRVIGWSHGWVAPKFLWVEMDMNEYCHWFDEKEQGVSNEIPMDKSGWPTLFCDLQVPRDDSFEVDEINLSRLGFVKNDVGVYEIDDVNIVRPPHNESFNKIKLFLTSVRDKYARIVAVNSRTGSPGIVYDGILHDMDHLRKILDDTMLSDKYQKI